MAKGILDKAGEIDYIYVKPISKDNLLYMVRDICNRKA